MTSKKNKKTTPRTFYVYTGIGGIPVRIHESLDTIVVGELESPTSHYFGTVYSYTEGTVGCLAVGYMDQLQAAYMSKVAAEKEADEAKQEAAKEKKESK